MSEINFKNKYLKYKNKYLELKSLSGGLINYIDKSELARQKEDFTVPHKLKEYISLITIKNSKVIRVGSSSFKIQPFFSDVDIMNIIEKDLSIDQSVRFFIDELKSNITKIKSSSSVFFSDFKAGNMHWSIDEILNELKEGKTLTECCKIKDIIKLDMIAPYNERYVEMSTFYILKSNQGYVNIEKDYFDSLEKSLKEDIEHYKDDKPLKAIKRAWSLAKIKNDINSMNKLKDIMKSNLSLLSQINADIETIKILVEHESAYDVEFVINQVEKFKESIASILDIKIDEKIIYIMVENIVVVLKSGSNSKEKLLEALNTLHDYLLQIINKETKEYITSVHYHFPTEKIGLLEQIKHMLLDGISKFN
jgi:hypothetical protein